MQVFKYTDYYSAFEGKCPKCGEIILVEVDEVDSDGVAYNVKCPVCLGTFDCQLEW